MVQGIRTPAPADTTSEPQVGNGLPGAPVNAPMSGGVMFTATRVEPWNDRSNFIPPLIFQGWDFLIFTPILKEGNPNERRKSVHL